jgi:GT2 family glycosyltransferase
MKNISFCINTARNELDHIKLLFKSLQQNLHSLEHEVLVFIDSDNQNTFEWLLTQKETFSNLRILRNTQPVCYGYARNINEMFEQASNDIVSYLQSDMVVCKDYDLILANKVQPNMVLCSTRIEPPLHGNSGEKHTYDFGLDPLTFDLEAFTKYADSCKQDKTTSYFFAPFTMYKEVWNSIGGHDTMFRRSREDTDVLTRLVLSGADIVQTWEALVYHFTCTSSRGLNWFDPNNTEAQERVKLQEQADAVEMKRYVRKWGKFEHTTQTSETYRYNVSAVIKGPLSLEHLLAFDYYFNQLHIEDEAVAQKYKDLFTEQHDYANKLLKFTDDNWKEYGYMYNQKELHIHSTKEEDFTFDDVVVEFAIQDVNQQTFQEVIQMLQPIIHNISEEGSYEVGGVKIHVNTIKNRVLELLQANNPKVKQEHMYETY